MPITLRLFQEVDKEAWNSYVLGHPDGTYCHLAGWKEVIEKAYGHKTYYLIAIKENQDSIISGILPLVHLKHFLFGNHLVSIPFFDLGGLLADDQETERALLSEAIKLGCQLGVDKIELRQTTLLPSAKLITGEKYFLQTKSHKVRMLLSLPKSPEILIKSFKSKLRSQINKPLKEGLYSKMGGLELLEDFYQVFLINMRDLGSPVHSKKLMKLVLQEFSENTQLIVIYKEKIPLACSLIVVFKDIVENPWASALKEYNPLSPNMLLYWTMLEYACKNGYSFFDFGRSSVDQGTYKFKEQWGAEPTPLHWHLFVLNGHQVTDRESEKAKFDKAIEYWKKLPVFTTRLIGPYIRKHISL